MSRGARQLLAWLPEDEPQRSQVARSLAERLAHLGDDQVARTPILVGEINGMPAADHPLGEYLTASGFSPSAMGYQIRKHA